MATAKKTAAKKAAGKKAAKKTDARKYSPAASRSVEREMKALKEGKLKSGSGAKVTNPKQAIAIGLSEARRAGAKMPAPPPTAAKKAVTTKAKKAVKAAAKKSVKAAAKKTPGKKAAAKKRTSA